MLRSSLNFFKRFSKISPIKNFNKISMRNISILTDSSNLTEDQQAIQEVAYDFAKNELLPNAQEWDEKKFFPKDVLRKAAELGFASIYIDEKYGGSNLGRLEASLIFEALATGCVSSSAYLSIHNMNSNILFKSGNEEQKEKWLSRMTNLELFSSYCLTEPNSGSDSRAMQTTAKKVGNEYVITGQKCFISGGEQSDLYFLMCKTSEKDVSCIVVENGAKGFTFGKNEKKMGWNSSPTQMLFFDEVRVPASHLLGKEGEGFKIAMQGLDGGRINIASCSLGGAAFALEAAKDHIKVRKQFGKTLSEFQYLQFKLAELATDLKASRLIVREAAKMIDSDDADKSTYAAMAKTFATNKCFDIANYALQMHGGYGYLKDYPVERIFRDLRVNLILEGSDEIMKMIISRNLLK